MELTACSPPVFRKVPCRLENHQGRCSLLRLFEYLFYKGVYRLYILLKEIAKFFLKNLMPISFLTLAIELPYIFLLNFKYFTELPQVISSGFSTILFFASFVIYPLATGAQTFLYYQIINDSKLDIKKCIVESKKYLINLVIGSFLYLILTLLGLIAFIIPGIIIGVRLSFYCFLIVFENYPPLDALKESYRITTGYTWQIATPSIILGIPIVAASILIQEFFITIDLYNIFFGTIIDSIFAILGWLNLILFFRFYCIYKDKGKLN